MSGIAAVFLLLLIWERRNLTLWRGRKAVAFLAFWTLTLAWAVAIQTHAAIPTLPDLTRVLFGGLPRVYLTPQPDIYW